MHTNAIGMNVHSLVPILLIRIHLRFHCILHANKARQSPPSRSDPASPHLPCLSTSHNASMGMGLNIAAFISLHTSRPQHGTALLPAKARIDVIQGELYHSQSPKPFLKQLRQIWDFLEKNFKWIIWKCATALHSCVIHSWARYARLNRVRLPLANWNNLSQQERAMCSHES